MLGRFRTNSALPCDSVSAARQSFLFDPDLSGIEFSAGHPSLHGWLGPGTLDRGLDRAGGRIGLATLQEGDSAGLDERVIVQCAGPGDRPTLGFAGRRVEAVRFRSGVPRRGGA